MSKQHRNQDYLIRVGKKLVELRTDRNITQEKLQELTGFDTRQIGRLERAETNANISIIKTIADVLKIKVSDILDV